MSNLPDILRLLAKVDFVDDCWLWQGWTHEGYGYCWFRGRTRRVHRVTFLLFRGEIPNGLTLDHLCPHRACCNPWHMEPVTGQINNIRSDSLTARNLRKIFCVAGHFLGENNVYSPPSRPHVRICRACARRRDHNYKITHRRAINVT